jgi:hypothetical protein
MKHEVRLDLRKDELDQLHAGAEAALSELSYICGGAGAI